MVDLSVLEGAKEKPTETKVAGRNIMVTAAIVIIEELSFRVSSAMLLDISAIFRLVRLSPWLARLKNRSMRILVRVM